MLRSGFHISTEISPQTTEMLLPNWLPAAVHTETMLMRYGTGRMKRVIKENESHERTPFLCGWLSVLELIQEANTIIFVDSDTSVNVSSTWDEMDREITLDTL